MCIYSCILILQILNFRKYLPINTPEGVCKLFTRMDPNPGTLVSCAISWLVLGIDMNTDVELKYSK